MPTISDVPLPTVGGGSPDLVGVLGVPDGDGPWPGVVMVHEAFGVTDVMRRQVSRMAEAGFLVLMPDLFTAGSTRRCLIATFRAIARGRGRAFDDVEAARRVLAARADLAGGIGVLGFCMGGGFALMAVRGRGFQAASVNYGRLPKQLEASLAGACPVVASFGGRDGSLRGAAAVLETALETAGVPHDVREYPMAGHAFLDDEAPRVAPPLDFLMRHVLHVGPDPAASADAWRRIDDFFRIHLASSSSPS